MSMKTKQQIICGIDPGLRQTGYGILRVDEDDEMTVVEAGVIRASTEGPLSVRLAELAQGIDEVLDEHRVETVAVEQIYSHYQRPRTAILMAHARGVVLLEAARRNADVLHLPSTTVKRHLTGNGRAGKEQIQRAVTRLLKLKQIPEPPDVADALAIAVCAVSVLRQPARHSANNDDLLIQ